MKKVFQLLAVASVGALSFGCVVTDYNFTRNNPVVGDFADFTDPMDNYNLGETLQHCSANQADPITDDAVGGTKDIQSAAASLLARPLDAASLNADGTACANLNAFGVYTTQFLGKKDAKAYTKQLGGYFQGDSLIVFTNGDWDDDGDLEWLQLDNVGVKDLPSDCDGNGAVDLRLTTMARLAENTGNDDWACGVNGDATIHEGELFGSQTADGQQNLPGYISVDRRQPAGEFAANIVAGNPLYDPAVSAMTAFFNGRGGEGQYDYAASVKNSEGLEASLLDVLGGQNLYVELANGGSAGFRFLTTERGATIGHLFEIGYQGNTLQLDRPLTAEVNLENRAIKWNPAQFGDVFTQIQAWADEVLPRTEDGNYGPFEVSGTINVGGQIIELQDSMNVLRRGYLSDWAGEGTLGQRASIDRDLSVVRR